MRPAAPALREIAAITLLVAGCAEPPAVEVAGLTVDLITPADIDPFEGVDRLLLRVLDPGGEELAQSLGDPDQGVSLPPITTFGRVEIEVIGLGEGQVVAAARTGLVTIEPGDTWQIDTLFLPINREIPLAWSPSTARIGHATLSTPSGRVLLLGGRSPASAAITPTTEWWDVRLGFDGLGPSLPSGQAGAATARLPDGSMILAGGLSSEGPTDAVTRVLADGTAAQALDPLPTERDRVCAASHPTLGVLVFARDAALVYGADGLRGRASDLSADPIDGCVGIGDRVLVTGEVDGGWGVLSPGRATWPTPLAPSFEPIAGVRDTRGALLAGLDDGTGWVGGGFETTARRLTYRIDLDQATAERGPDLTTARVGGTVAIWRDGRIVLAGGHTDLVQTQAVRTVEIFDPDTGPMLSVPVTVRAPSLSVLPGGALLLTGGLDANGDAGGAVGIMPWIDDR